MSPGEEKREEVRPKPELKSEVLDAVKGELGDRVIESGVERERRLFIRIKKEDLVEVCRRLHDDMGFDHLSLITGIEWEDKFECVYHLWSYSNNNILAVRVDLPKEENPSIDSVTSIWRSADWHERETFDLMGIVFEGHPNLTRILNPDDFEGHPLRKDFKLTENPMY
jgi:NADH-quinone oxidoreductase subunit C